MHASEWIPSTHEGFLSQFWTDWAEGCPRPLREYLEMFPGAEDAIAAVWVQHAAGRVRRTPKASGQDSIGHYRLLAEIGRGGQGIVYRAEDTRLNRPVALKILRDAPGAEARSVIARFKREAAVAAKLQHPSICSVLDAGILDGSSYIAMQFIPGRTLAWHIKAAKDDPRREHTTIRLNSDLDDEPKTEGDPDSRSGAVSHSTTPGRDEVMQITQLIEKAARALQVAHEAGVVHRDIKPGNIMVTPEGDPVLLDFGMARGHEDDHGTITQTGDFFGTPAYMSPEQLRGQHALVDQRTDVYSLGVTLFECLTCSRPFVEVTRESLFHAILHQDPPHVRSLNRAIPSDLATVLHKALEKDCDRRYESAGAFADELGRARRREPIHARQITRWIRVRRWAQRNPVVATLSILVFLSLLSTAVVFFIKHREVSEEVTAKQKALDDYQRMSDVKRLDDAIRTLSTMHPPHPDLVPKLDDWLKTYEPLFDRLGEHEEVLKRLQKRGLSPTDKSQRGDHAKEGSEATSNRRTWDFASADDAFMHETLVKLVEDLRHHKSEGGALPFARQLLKVSAKIRKKTVEDHAPAWAETIAAIAASPKYGGLKIEPQIGLIPLGRDETTGLFEFLHWLTHGGETPLPVRDREGRLELEEHDGIILVLLPAGEFQMGATREPGQTNHDPMADGSELPVHSVRLDAFFIGKHEVNQAQWFRTTGKKPSRYGIGDRLGEHTTTALHPVERVSWLDCTSALRRCGLTIPTESQWEYACRAGSSTIWSCGNDISDLGAHANLADRYFHASGVPHEWRYDEEYDDGRMLHAPIGSYTPNAFGLHDMHGNVAEWCLDGDTDYRRDAAVPGTGHRPMKDEGVTRVRRGGGFMSIAERARTGCRIDADWDARDSAAGCRAARNLDR